jgi:hypothetical protein
MPESGTSGSVRDRDGKPPGLLDLRPYWKAQWATQHTSAIGAIAGRMGRRSATGAA